MCDACDPKLDRRTLLRRALIGASALAGSGSAGLTLWSPGRASAGENGGGALEQESMAEDRKSAKRTAGTVRGVRQVAGPNLNALAPPPVTPRSGWGADEAIRLDSRAYAPVRKLIVHHSASENRPRNPAEVVRFIQRYHTTNRGFFDTGYNYLIDHKGVIYEGRAARIYNQGEPIANEDNRGWGVVGAHARGNNAGSCGICLIGNFETASPTDAAVASLVSLLAYKASRYRIDAIGNDVYIDLFGNRRVFPNVSGHRQVGATACPGRRLFSLLPSIRGEVARRAGRWDPLTVDVPFVVRWEVGRLRRPKASANPATPETTAPPSAPATEAVEPTPPRAPSGGTTPPVNSADHGTGTAMIGVRVISSRGTVYTAGRTQAGPAPSGLADAVALANTTSGGGYWALDRGGVVKALGGAGHFGDASGKGPAADLAVTADGRGYWILMADGGIYPFGNARYASSPKRLGIGAAAIRIVARPQGDGYWVLLADGSVRAFGSAPPLGAPTGLGSAVDVAVTPTGEGYRVLTDAGVVAPFGDASDKGDVKRTRVKWSKKPAHLLSTPSGAGYVVVNGEGSMLAFGDAPLYPSFGASGMTATGVAPAFG